MRQGSDKGSRFESVPYDLVAWSALSHLLYPDYIPEGWHPCRIFVSTLIICSLVVFDHRHQSTEWSRTWKGWRLGIHYPGFYPATSPLIGCAFFFKKKKDLFLLEGLCLHAHSLRTFSRLILSSFGSLITRWSCGDRVPCDCFSLYGDDGYNSSPTLPFIG